MAKINIILAVSNPLVLTAMSELFERDDRFSLVATASSSQGFIETVMRAPVDVGVIDWNLSGLGGSKLIELMRDMSNPPRLVVYGENTGDLSRLAMTAGAAGFSSPSDPVDDLFATCVDVAAGKMVFPFLDIRSLQQDPINQLSKRERVMLEALSKGLTNRELSTELGISTNTVKFHLSNMYEKLDLKNRAQAIAFFYSSRLAAEAASVQNDENSQAK